MSADVSLRVRLASTTCDQDESAISNLGCSPGAMPILAQRYHALPIQYANTPRSNVMAQPGTGEPLSRTENTLRRKTPNGTLNAGFEGSTENPSPPLKQQVLPLSDGSASHVLQPLPASDGKRTFLEHQRQQQQYLREQRAGRNTWFSPVDARFQNVQASQPPGARTFPMVDSALYQMSAYQLNSHPYQSQTVPSVIQPSAQHLDPTALGGRGCGPYGPYWHDGTYIPYRPAAIRDPRFYHQPVADVAGPLPSSQLALGQGWPQTPPQFGQWNFHQHASPLNTPLPHPSGLNTFARPVGNGANGHQHGASSPVHGYPAFSTSERHQGSPFIPDFNPFSSKGMSRDQTFAWALQQYRDLLHYIHHTKRNQQSQGKQHSNHRFNFYPKPPRASNSSSYPSQKIQRDGITGSDSKQPRVDAAAAAIAGISEGKNIDQFSEIEQHDFTKPRSASLWTPNGERLPSLDDSRRASHDQPPKMPGLSHAGTSASNLSHATKFSFDRPPSAMAMQYPPDGSPPSRAASAFQRMENLCQASKWRWTDGMHLGGCLAYALGDYHTALKWYKKVLEIDPRHLEAESNLAAALLALDQRQEAEKHWMKVIKTAPNHFEAVEHLVGLLCSDQRSKDAIKVIEYVENAMRAPQLTSPSQQYEQREESSSSTTSRSPCVSELSDKAIHEFEMDGETNSQSSQATLPTPQPGFGSSGYAIPGSENGRILALIHAKGNMLYGLGDNGGAARAFEDAVLIATGRNFNGIQGLARHILMVVSSMLHAKPVQPGRPATLSSEPILLVPDQAKVTAQLCFGSGGELPGLEHISRSNVLARKAVISTTSNSLLSLAKIFQDAMSNSNRSAGVTPLEHGVRDILALYYLSLSLQPSPSTANNVGILLASVQQVPVQVTSSGGPQIPGVVPGSGTALALAYYNYGLELDKHHAHLYTNLGSLLKDIGQLDAAINMYERAVQCDGKFDIALANLANAVKDKGRISDAITYYKRAVEVSPDFAEAVCGLANALNSVCSWQARGGVADDGGRRDRWHVDGNGALLDGRDSRATSTGWIKRVVNIVEKQLADGENWGIGSMSSWAMDDIVRQFRTLRGDVEDAPEQARDLRKRLLNWSGHKWEGARIARFVERATRRVGWHWYRDLHVAKIQRPLSSYLRPQLPPTLAVPAVPTVLPFHTFTCPMSAQQIRLISQRNGQRISISTLRSPWLPAQVYPPPKPPTPFLRVGYVSSDFNNHPLAHLMQSVFGLHDLKRVEAYCYATTASDNSVHRHQIEAEAPVFRDASTWSPERLVNQIVRDGIHILVNLNGYTRGARNEVFAARPAPIQMSFMGFASTLGAEWCDYLLADETAVPVGTLRPWRRNVDLEDTFVDENCDGGSNEDWVYGENIIYCRDTFFCCDHKQSAPDASGRHMSWDEELKKRWQMRKQLFPQISDDVIIFGNFNQLYKIEPTTFRTWLRILAQIPNSILWLLRFPDLGESHLLATARLWAGNEVASRVIFTDVAPKHLHISRARICDLVLDTAECNAHTTAADVLWSGTPLLTLPRFEYKMCSRMAASILKGALPKDEEGVQAAKDLIATSEEDYEEKAVALGKSFSYIRDGQGTAKGKLMELRRMLFRARWSSALFDTTRWVRDLEDAYDEAWRRWVDGVGGDIWLDKIPAKGTS